MKKTHIKSIPVVAAAIFAAAFSLNAAPVAEPDAETAVAAKRLMKTMGVAEQIAPMFESVKKMQASMLDQQELTDEQKARAKEILAASFDEVAKAFEWSRLEGMLVRVYGSTFTAEEMDRLSDFFAGPDGKVFVERQLKLQEAMMVELQGVMMAVMPKIQKATQEAIERAKGDPTGK